jgi:hypothetical protein
MDTEIQIRAFRAMHDPDTCLRFILGHQKVLENHGIYKVSSSAVDWMYSPSVFVIVVESMDRTKLFGGARIHAFSEKELLPIEEATGQMDKRIHTVVRKRAEKGTGELCGLWNSIEVAGPGHRKPVPLAGRHCDFRAVRLKFFIFSLLTTNHSI